MGLIISIKQESKDTSLTFEWATGIHPASGLLEGGSIYQAYVQAAGMSVAGTYNNAVCNMAYTPNAPTFTVVNSCGNTMLSTITTKNYTGVTGEDTNCYNPWSLNSGYQGLDVNPTT